MVQLEGEELNSLFATLEDWEHQLSKAQEDFDRLEP